MICVSLPGYRWVSGWYGDDGQGVGDLGKLDITVQLFGLVQLLVYRNGAVNEF